jgi:hypothetical protein
MIPIHAGPSPFDRLVAYEIYDGPTHGVAIHSKNGDAFLFEMVAWDDKQTRRVFGLAPLQHELSHSLVRSLSQIEQPRWPEWWIRAGAPQAELEISTAVAIAREGAGLPAWVVITSGLLGQLDQVCELKPRSVLDEYQRRRALEAADAEVPLTTFESWRAFVSAHGGS